MEESGQLHAPTVNPREITPVAIEEAAAGAPEPVWTFWRREKSLSRGGIKTPDQLRSLVPIPKNALFRNV
jgi:hypothetical protein